MYKLKYNLSIKLIQNIIQIERLYGQLEGLRLPPSLQLNLERKNLIYSSYVSNSIEGNPLSLPEVINLILDDRVPINRDEKEVKNYFDILKILKDHAGKDFNLDAVLTVHKKLLTGVANAIAGKIRNKEVVVGKYKKKAAGISLEIKHNPPFHKAAEIEQALKELVNWAQKEADIPSLIKVGIFHHQFVFIHPFIDGNGRTCRLLTALLFLKHGYAVNKYFVLDDYYDVDRFLYSDKLHSADFGDKTEWLEYFTDGVKYSLQSALAKVKQAVIEAPMASRLSKKEQEVFELLRERGEFTSGELSEKLKVSRQQAHHLLWALVEKGYAEKMGKTKASYYRIK
jgi:Fic family protein